MNITKEILEKNEDRRQTYASLINNERNIFSKKMIDINNELIDFRKTKDYLESELEKVKDLIDKQEKFSKSTGIENDKTISSFQKSQDVFEFSNTVIKALGTEMFDKFIKEVANLDHRIHTSVGGITSDNPFFRIEIDFNNTNEIRRLLVRYLSDHTNMDIDLNKEYLEDNDLYTYYGKYVLESYREIFETLLGSFMDEYIKRFKGEAAIIGVDREEECLNLLYLSVRYYFKERLNESVVKDIMNKMFKENLA